MTTRQILTGEETKWNRSRTRNVHKSPNQSERLQERAYKYAHWFNPKMGDVCDCHGLGFICEGCKVTPCNQYCKPSQIEAVCTNDGCAGFCGRRHPSTSSQRKSGEN